MLSTPRLLGMRLSEIESISVLHEVVKQKNAMSVIVSPGDEAICVNDLLCYISVSAVMARYTSLIVLAISFATS